MTRKISLSLAQFPNVNRRLVQSSKLPRQMLKTRVMQRKRKRRNWILRPSAEWNCVSEWPR
jgi:hypothetical protein